jgi:uracil-DNA glycosylase
MRSRAPSAVTARAKADTTARERADRFRPVADGTLGEGRRAFATMHPSWVLRQRGGEERALAYRGFRDDLALLTRSSGGG